MLKPRIKFSLVKAEDSAFLWHILDGSTIIYTGEIRSKEDYKKEYCNGSNKFAFMSDKLRIDGETYVLWGDYELLCDFITKL